MTAFHLFPAVTLEQAAGGRNLMHDRVAILLPILNPLRRKSSTLQKRGAGQPKHLY